jgi:hypothetical protein
MPCLRARGAFGAVGLYAKNARTDRATWPLTTCPHAERPGICHKKYSPERFETMKTFTGGAAAAMSRCRRERRAAVTASLLVFGGCAAPTPPPSQEIAGAVSPLAGTHWQLVQLQSSEVGTLKPGGPTRHVMDLIAGGQHAMRLDCNRVAGRWEARPRLIAESRRNRWVREANFSRFSVWGFLIWAQPPASVTRGLTQRWLLSIVARRHHGHADQVHRLPGLSSPGANGQPECLTVGFQAAASASA